MKLTKEQLARIKEMLKIGASGIGINDTAQLGQNINIPQITGSESGDPRISNSSIDQNPNSFKFNSGKVLTINGLVDKPIDPVTPQVPTQLENKGTALPMQGDIGKFDKTFTAPAINIDPIPVPDLTGLSDIFQQTTGIDRLTPQASADTSITDASLTQAQNELGALSDFLLSDKFANDQLRASGKGTPGRLSPVASGIDQGDNVAKLLFSNNLSNKELKRKQRDSLVSEGLLKSENSRKDRALNLRKFLAINKGKRDQLSLDSRIKDTLARAEIARRGATTSEKAQLANARNSTGVLTLNEARFLKNAEKIDIVNPGLLLQQAVVKLSKAKDAGIITDEEFKQSLLQLLKKK